MVTLPFSLCVCFKVNFSHNQQWFKSHLKTFQVVQEYERAVIFRLGRLLSGGSRGPGKYLEYNSARWFFGGGKLLQLHLVFFRERENSKTFKAAQLRRRITSSPLMHSSHWHCDFRAFRYFLRTSVRRELHKGRPSHLGYWHSPAGGLFHVWPKVLHILATHYYHNAQPWSAWSKKMKKKELETSKMNCSSPIQLLSNPRMQSYNTQ